MLDGSGLKRICIENPYSIVCFLPCSLELEVLRVTFQAKQDGEVPLKELAAELNGIGKMAGAAVGSLSFAQFELSYHLPSLINLQHS